MSRRIVCSKCRQLILVHEVPCEFIDPVLYVCGECLRPAEIQLEISEGQRVETVRYDPAIAEIPL